MKKSFLMIAAGLCMIATAAYAAGFDHSTLNVYDTTAETASGLDSNCRIPMYDLDDDADAVVDNVDSNADGDAGFITCTDVYGIGSAKAGAFTDITATGDLSGDGADQFFGFKQDQVASTTVAITAAQAGKTFVSNSADVMTLPEASTVLGARYTFVCGTADDFDINPADGTDQIGSVSTTNGTTGVVTLAPSAGDAIRCTDIGGSITLEAVGNDLWAQVAGGNGIWTDVN